MAKWYKHPKHGFMLRVDMKDGYEVVVTALCLDVMDLELDAKLWEAHKSRLHVNGGCGAIACDVMRWGDRNPDFKPCRKVPEHIRKDFIAAAD